MVIYVYNYVYSKKKCYDIINIILILSENVTEVYIKIPMYLTGAWVFLFIFCLLKPV